jgi:2-polyprenyl-6-methoxyphenol hydroxylase-like FAD-dependent oxidoreductase
MSQAQKLQSLPVRYDVVVIGAGLAGLSLARQLLMQSDKKILLLEKQPQVPISRQKVGEATVQVSAYYFSKALDLEEHLLREHFLKYNLRFYWKTPGLKNDCYEDYSQSYIRNVSNIATYQLNRNKIEEELLRLNLQHPNFFCCCGISNLDVSLSDSESPHVVRFACQGRELEIQTRWVVDTAGRAKFLSRRLELTKPSPIRHGATFFWVDGLLNIEKLTGLSDGQRLIHKNRRMTGHLPVWLATNHFAGEGYWFWVIPLQGRTSLGLVYDKTKVPEEEVSPPEKAVAWICQQFPLFARDLPNREIVDHGRFSDFAYDCRQTISAQRWALSGEAGRFSDPLYSPGGDIIALYNTLITDAILTGDPVKLALKTRIYDRLMWAFYEAYVPSFTDSYAVLGDQECFSMKYSWELTIYFTFYVFPFINQVLTEPGFALPFLDLFARLGVLNRNIQAFITQYYYWKKDQPVEAHEPRFFDFMGFDALRKAEQLFYQVGLSGPDCLETSKVAMANIETLARFIAVYIYSAVLGDEGLLTNEDLAESIQIEKLCFDPESMRRQCSHLHEAEDRKLLETASQFIAQFSGRPVMAKSGVPE